MKVALCCIGRLENRYIKEYVEYYKKLGVDKIFIYDNNHDGEEHFEDVIGEHVDNGFVEIIDFRNKEVKQLEAYQDCYNNRVSDYDWVCFFDIDEFLEFSDKTLDIKSFLSQDKFNNFDLIHVNWLCYSDNNLVHYEDKPLRERFTSPVEPLDYKLENNFPENYHVKTIIRTRIEGIKWNATPHTPNNILKSCNPSGVETLSTAYYSKYDYSCAWLNHYRMKTIEEWLYIKQKRVVADRTHERFDVTYKAEQFFKENKMTAEKRKILNKFIEEKQKNNKKNLDIFICSHKDFIPSVKNSCYKIVYARKVNNKSKTNLKSYDAKNLDLPLNDIFYNELYSFKYIRENVKLKKYIGFCHYRRYYEFMDDIPDMDKIFEKYDCVISKPINFKMTIREHYKIMHNEDDLNIIELIIKEKYPEYYDTMEFYLDKNSLFIPCNMFIMKTEDFIEYIKFIYDVFEDYINIVGIDITKRIEDNKDKYLKSFYPNNTIWYQYRIGGYIGERLTNIFMFKHFKKMKAYSINITENKYKDGEKTI